MARGEKLLQNLMVLHRMLRNLFPEVSREHSLWWGWEGSFIMYLAWDRQRFGSISWMPLKNWCGTGVCDQPAAMSCSHVPTKERNWKKQENKGQQYWTICKRFPLTLPNSLWDILYWSLVSCLKGSQQYVTCPTHQGKTLDRCYAISSWCIQIHCPPSPWLCWPWHRPAGTCLHPNDQEGKKRSPKHAAVEPRQYFIIVAGLFWNHRLGQPPFHLQQHQEAGGPCLPCLPCSWPSWQEACQ